MVSQAAASYHMSPGLYCQLTQTMSVYEYPFGSTDSVSSPSHSLVDPSLCSVFHSPTACFPKLPQLSLQLSQHQQDFFYKILQLTLSVPGAYLRGGGSNRSPFVSEKKLSKHFFLRHFFSSFPKIFGRQKSIGGIS